jgi:soluble lytic murein transglycosylase-like protein
MNALIAKVPLTDKFFYPDASKSQVKAALDKIYATYKSAIDNSAALTNVPKDVITSFIFIESNGKVDAISSAGAIGIMQLMTTSASDILVMEKNKGRLSESEKAVLSTNLGKRFTEGIMKMRFLGDKKTVDGVTSATWITKADLLKPSLNILIGSIYLSLLIDESTRNGKVDLHKVVVRYNRGYFSDGRGSKIPESVNEALLTSSMPTESKNYILKFVGKNGTLDLLT